MPDTVTNELLYEVLRNVQATVNRTEARVDDLTLRIGHLEIGLAQVQTRMAEMSVRMDRVDRLKLARRFETVSTEYGSVTVKIGLLGGETVQVSPEFESCKALSEKTGQPIRTIYEAAVQAWAEARPS